MQATEPEKMGLLCVMALFDRHMYLIYRRWPKIKDSKVTGWQTEAVREDLMAACCRLPIFNPMKRPRGLSAWCGGLNATASALGAPIPAELEAVLNRLRDDRAGGAIPAAGDPVEPAHPPPVPDLPVGGTARD